MRSSSRPVGAVVESGAAPDLVAVTRAAAEAGRSLGSHLADAMAAAFERNEATRSRALAAARPYARPVRGPKKKTSVSSSGG